MTLMNWTPEKSVATEYFAEILDRHNKGASENDIRMAFRDFLIQTGIAARGEIASETAPAEGSLLKVDLHVRNTYVEFKRDVIRAGAIDPAHIAQLDEYILENAKAGSGVQNGILTDGKNYLKRSVGDHLRALATENAHRVFSSPAQGHRLYEYLYDIVDTQESEIAPTDANLTKHFGADSAAFKTATALLSDAHARNRDEPTVAVKRKLWRELLQVALGEDSLDDDSRANDWLYVRHTYLTSLIAVIVQARFGIDAERYAADDPRGLLNGDILRRTSGLRGIAESDLFAWAPEVGETRYLQTIARAVAKFDWEKDAGDLAAVLYQNAITADERKRMGEYYTPAWLAETMAREMIADPANDRVLDPACGSGAFIGAAVRRLIAETEHMPPKERLARLQRNIIGIDLHPVAVQLAKATWVMNAQPAIAAARADGGGEDAVAPIYLGDSLQLRYDSGGLIGQRSIELRTGEVVDETRGEIVFQIPLTLARQADRFDSLTLALAAAIEREDDARRVLDEYGIAGDDRKALENTIDGMESLRAAGRDHVWAYYLRNMTRPAVIADRKVDVIIGNPPWLAYNQNAGIIREELRALSRDLYQIWAGGRNAPNQDVSTLFFCRVMDLYLKEGGLIGMVMPHSALRSGQHLKWRLGYYEAKRARGEPQRAISADFGVKPPWDLKNLTPNDFFPITAGVAFARFSGGWGDAEQRRAFAKPLAPGMVEIWRGATDSADVRRETANLIHDDGEFRSPYADLAKRGADIFDRRLYFVTVHPNKGLLALPNTRVTHPETGGGDKKKYAVGRLRGFVVDCDNLFDVYLGESIAPYVALTPRTAALPASRAAMSVPLDHSACGPPDSITGDCKRAACALDKQGLNDNMRDRWEIMERLWDANKKASDRKTLFQRLNYHSIFTSQLAALRAMPPGGVRVAYATSGRPTAAIIADDKAIVDTKLYQIICADADEAHYLLAFINSVTLEDAVEPFRPTGRFGKGGARDLHKHLWKLPIPRYEANDAAHIALSELGKRAAQTARERVAAIANRSVARIRRDLRDWQRADADCAEIERLAGEILGMGRG